MGRRRERLSRALEVLGTARRSRMLRVLREVGLAGQRPATAEAAREFRARAGRTRDDVKLGQLLTSRPDLMPDPYIAELSRLVDEVPPVPFAEIEPVIRSELGAEAFVRIEAEPLAAGCCARRSGDWRRPSLPAMRSHSPLARLPRRIGQIADRLETGTLRVGITPTHLEGLEAVMRSAANRIGAAVIVAGLLLASAWMARVNDAIAVVGFTVAAVLGLYMLWKILRTPGSL